MLFIPRQAEATQTVSIPTLAAICSHDEPFSFFAWRMASFISFLVISAS
jgi:hypothetical protein